MSNEDIHSIPGSLMMELRSVTRDYNHTVKILLCIPAYNEAQSIANIIQKANAHATEVIVCDDGSTDDTYEAAKAAGATVIRHTSNKEYGAAINTLFCAARQKNADIVVTLDSDGQHNPDQIPDIIEPILSGTCDIVIGSRFISNNRYKQNLPKYRSLGIKTITTFTTATSSNTLTDAQSGFRAYSKNALSKLNLFEEGMAASTEILLRAKEGNLLVKEVPIVIDYDVEDASTYNPIVHGLSVLHAVIQFISLRHPLAFYGLPGIALLIISAIFINNALELFNTTRHYTRYISIY